MSCMGWGWGPQNHGGTRTDVPMLGPEPLSPCPPRDKVGRPHVGTGTDSPCSLWDGAGSPQSRDGTRTDVPKVVPEVCCAPCHDGTQTDVPTMTHCPHVLHGVGLSVPPSPCWDMDRCPPGPGGLGTASPMEQEQMSPCPQAGTRTDVPLSSTGWGQSSPLPLKAQGQPHRCRVSADTPLSPPRPCAALTTSTAAPRATPATPRGGRACRGGAACPG